jgi:predicted O-methyltransferase YrrM
MKNEHLEQIISQTLSGTGDICQLTASIFGIALTTRGKNFLELGVRSGHSTQALLCAAHYLNAKVTSVDIETPSFKCPEIFSNNWNFVKSEAIEFLTKNNQKYDLIFIDDWHDGIHVKKELDIIDSFSDKSTVILLHDLMYGFKNPNYNTCKNGQECNWGEFGEFDNGGPYWAVSQLNSIKWEFSTLPFNNGLTILRKII